MTGSKWGASPTFRPRLSGQVWALPEVVRTAPHGPRLQCVMVSSTIVIFMAVPAPHCTDPLRPCITPQPASQGPSHHIGTDRSHLSACLTSRSWALDTSEWRLSFLCSGLPEGPEELLSWASFPQA